MKNLFPGHLNTSTNKSTGNFPGTVSVTEIHRESHSCINTHTVTITNNSVFYAGFFSVTMLLMKLTKTSTDQRRLLPGGPFSPEGSTVGPRVLSFT